MKMNERFSAKLPPEAQLQDHTGALPQDPAGTEPPDCCYRFAHCAHHGPTTRQIMHLPLWSAACFYLMLLWCSSNDYTYFCLCTVYLL